MLIGLQAGQLLEYAQKLLAHRFEIGPADIAQPPGWEMKLPSNGPAAEVDCLR
jgi:hypothetical protein